MTSGEKVPLADTVGEDWVVECISDSEGGSVVDLGHDGGGFKCVIGVHLSSIMSVKVGVHSFFMSLLLWY